MKQHIKNRLGLSLSDNLLQKVLLLFVMVSIGVFSIYASLNTFEVIAQRDTPLSNVIVNKQITSNEKLDDMLTNELNKSYDIGSFGVPKKVKFPESDRHIDITYAFYEGGWKTSKGIGHTFVIEDHRKKVFGKAVIYMRINTATTQNLGGVFVGDIVNIVTTEGWQLGYRIERLATDPKDLFSTKSKDSEIIVILLDETSNEKISFVAELAKVGERI